MPSGLALCGLGKTSFDLSPTRVMAVVILAIQMGAQRILPRFAERRGTARLLVLPGRLWHQFLLGWSSLRQCGRMALMGVSTKACEVQSSAMFGVVGRGDAADGGDHDAENRQPLGIAEHLMQEQHAC